MSIWADTDDCNTHGIEEDGEWIWDTGWYGDEWENSGKDEWGQKWTTFQIAFTIWYVILLVVTIWRINVSITGERFLGYKAYFRKLRSPKIVALILIIVICIFKLLWLNVDPLRQYQKLDAVSYQLITLIPFPIYLTIFAIVLLISLGLYQGIMHSQSRWIYITRRAVLVLVLLNYPWYILMAIFGGLRWQSDWVTGWLKVPILLSYAIIVVLYLFWMWLINRYIKCFKPFLFKDQDEQVVPQTISQSYVISSKKVWQDESTMIMPEVQTPIINKRSLGSQSNAQSITRMNSIDENRSRLLMSEPQKSKLVTKARSFIPSPSLIYSSPSEIEEDHIDESSILCSSPSFKEFALNPAWTSLDSQQNYVHEDHMAFDYDKYNKVDSGHSRIRHFAMIIDKEDKFAIYMGCISTSGFMIFSTVFVLIGVVILSTSDAATNPDSQLAWLYVWFISEIFITVIVLVLFGTTIENKQKNSIKYMHRTLYKLQKGQWIVTAPFAIGPLDVRLHKHLDKK